MIAGVSPPKLVSGLRGRTVTGCFRKGKQMWWTLDRGPGVLWHFGMAGGFRSYEKVAERPRFLKVELTLDGGRRFGFVDPRRFGRVRLVEDPPSRPPLCEMGPDALDAMPGAAWWIAELRRRRTPVKTLLLNQAFVAGIGNWIADEVLYQSRIAPRREARDLAAAEVRRLRSKILRVLRKACDVEADASRFPKAWLFHHRWGKTPGALTARGEEIEFDCLGGRTTAWVPKVQV